MSTPAMSGPEWVCRVEALGLTAGWMIDLLNVSPRTYRRWLTAGPPPFAVERLLDLEEITHWWIYETAEREDDHAESGSPAAIVLEVVRSSRSTPTLGAWPAPATWHRHAMGEVARTLRARGHTVEMRWR